MTYDHIHWTHMKHLNGNIPFSMYLGSQEHFHFILFFCSVTFRFSRATKIFVPFLKTKRLCNTIIYRLINADRCVSHRFIMIFKLGANKPIKKLKKSCVWRKSREKKINAMIDLNNARPIFKYWKSSYFSIRFIVNLDSRNRKKKESQLFSREQIKTVVQILKIPTTSNLSFLSFIII